MVPTVLNESLLQPFKFYDGEQVTRAIWVGATVYRHVSSFSRAQGEQVHQICVALSNYGYPTLITTSDTGYRVWVDAHCKDKRCVGCPISGGCRCH